jgi:DNA-binding CsgD family transcriptional regulator
MGFELVIDGGCLNSPPIEAHCPLVAVSGPDAKLIMYDGVTLQNNKNRGSPLDTSYYENGAGVFIRTEGDVADRQAEFIMKGGTIRGNINDLQNPIAGGGGVQMTGFGIFTMEGGVIMNNTVRNTGGGFGIGSRGSFKKTGGIIYGSNAPDGFRNTALTGYNTPKNYGHAVWVSIINPSSQFRDDTVGENDNLSYSGVPRGNGIFGKGEKWDNPDKALRRMLVAVILSFLALAVCGFLILRRRYLKRLAGIVQAAADTTPYIDLENMDLSDREKDLCELLVSNKPLKEIADILGKGYSGVHKSTQNLYKKLGIEGRTELLVRVKSEQ